MSSVFILNIEYIVTETCLYVQIDPIKMTDWWEETAACCYPPIAFGSPDGTAKLGTHTSRHH
jgi:hypothetical protein